MTRDRPWLDPRSWAGVNRSSPRTRRPRRARCQAAALPMPPSPTTMTSWCRVIGGPSAQGGEALGDVDEARVLGRDLSEQGPGGGYVARPLLQIGQGVPEAEMVGEDPLGIARGPLQDLARLLELPLVGQRAGGDASERKTPR